MASREPDGVQLKKKRTTTPDIDPHLIQYMRIAVAIAIIRTKPSHLSGHQYAHELALQQREKQLLWQQTAEALQKEVFLLKQQLLERKMAEVVPDKDYNPTVIKSTGACTSGSDSQVFPTPPLSSEDPVNDAPPKPNFKQHQQFLQSVLTLSTISAHEPVQRSSLYAKSSAIDIVFEQTACENIESALIKLGDILTMPDPSGPPITPKMIHHAAEVIVNLTGGKHFSKHLYDVVCDKILRFSWGIMTAIIRNTNLTNDMCGGLCQLIVALTTTKVLCLPIISMLTTQAKLLGDHLRAVKEKKEQLDTKRFQMTYHLLRALELTFQSIYQSSNNFVSPEFCRAIEEQLDDSLLHIWEIFVPFTQYIWHIRNIIQNLYPTAMNNRKLSIMTR